MYDNKFMYDEKEVNMFYFDNAATGGRKPDSVQTAVSAAVKLCANPGRSGHRLSLSSANIVYDCRKTLNAFFDGYGFERVIFTKNCTEALNVAIFGCLKQGDHVIVSCMEHNSVLRPLEKLKKAGVITYDICPLEQHGFIGERNLCLESLQTLLRPNTKLVIITTASNVNGTMPSLEKLRGVLPKNVLLLCDGAQGGGHIDISIKKLGIDFLCLAGHKGMLGIQGSGALLFSERAKPQPLLYGGTGSISVSLDMPDFYPDALEAGTLSYPAIVSLLEGARYLSNRAKQIQSRLLMLSAYFLKGLQDLPDYIPYSIPNPCGIVAFKHAQMDSEQIAGILSEKYDIATRGGLHCAPLMHEALGTLSEGLVRASFSHFNSEREIDRLLTALQELN